MNDLWSALMAVSTAATCAWSGFEEETYRLDEANDGPMYLRRVRERDENDREDSLVVCRSTEPVVDMTRRRSERL